MKRENHQCRRIAGSVNAPRGLEDFRYARINVRCTVENCSGLLGCNAIRGWNMLIPTRAGRAKTTELVPVRGVWPAGEVDACEVGFSRKGQSFGVDIAKRFNTWRLRKLA